MDARTVEASGVRPDAVAPDGLEVVRRRGDDHTYVFVINHTEADARLDLTGIDRLTGSALPGDPFVPSGQTAVVREDGHAGQGPVPPVLLTDRQGNELCVLGPIP